METDSSDSDTDVEITWDTGVSPTCCWRGCPAPSAALALFAHGELEMCAHHARRAAAHLEEFPTQGYIASVVLREGKVVRKLFEPPPRVTEPAPASTSASAG